MAFNHMGSPIRTSPDQFLFADPRRFSQLTTSFFASGSLGILRSLFFSFSVNQQDSRPASLLLVAYEIVVPLNEKTHLLD